MYQLLIKCPLFKGINEAQLSAYFAKIKFKELKFAKNKPVVLNGQEVKNLLIVIQGSVRGEMLDYTGKVIKIEDIAPPRPLATAFIFGKQNVYPVNIITNENAFLLSIPRDSLIMLFQSNQLILQNFLNAISDRAQFLSQKLKFLSFQTIKGKFAHYLFQIEASQKTNKLVLPKSHSQLAELFGVARPSLSRAIRELDKEGLIEAVGKEVRIKDKKALMNYLN